MTFWSLKDEEVCVVSTKSILCAYTEFREKNEFGVAEFRECIAHIDYVLRIWHDRRVGIKEPDITMAAFQGFFLEFRELLVFLTLTELV